MPRYFLEFSYLGTNYSGFQFQINAISVQQKIEEALEVVLRKKVRLTGSSRTDTGVHAEQNFAHFDFEEKFPDKFLKRVNGVLTDDIALKSCREVSDESHARFDAHARSYEYRISFEKNPFLHERCWFYPYDELPIEKLNETAAILKEFDDFASFSKTRTQVKTTICNIQTAEWIRKNDLLIFCVTANRFLRGMVRALVASQIRVARGLITSGEFRKLIEEKNQSQIDFSAPASGLFLVEVKYPPEIFKQTIE